MDMNKIINLLEEIEETCSNVYSFCNEPVKGNNHPHSHTNRRTGKRKLSHNNYNANKTAWRMSKDTAKTYSAYICPKCGDYHVGEGKSRRMHMAIGAFYILEGLAGLCTKMRD